MAENSRAVIRAKERITAKKMMLPGMTLLVSLVLLVLNPQLLWETAETGKGSFEWGHLFQYLLLFGGICRLQMSDLRIPLKWQSSLRYAIFFLMPLVCVGTVEWINETDLWTKLNLGKWFGNYLCDLLILTVVYVLLGRLLPSLIVGALIPLIFGIATYYTILFRGSPVLPWDFRSITTALGVAAGYEYLVPHRMFTALLILLLILIGVSKIVKETPDCATQTLSPMLAQKNDEKAAQPSRERPEDHKSAPSSKAEPKGNRKEEQKEETRKKTAGETGGKTREEGNRRAGRIRPRVRSRNAAPKAPPKERLAFLALALVLAVAILPMDFLGTVGITVWPWNQKASTRMTGVAAGFFGNLQFVLVEKPQNYSVQRLRELYQVQTGFPLTQAGASSGERNETQSDGWPEDPQNPSSIPSNGSTSGTGEDAFSQEISREKPPTIIAIMNESFADMQMLHNAHLAGNLTLSEDNMPFIHQLMETEGVLSGTAYSSVFGGNTCDSEFEFLTGNSMYFLPVGSKPFQQYMQTPQSSLVSTLKSYGYRCMAVHPGNERAWNRDKAYPFLGFDDYLYNTEFETKRRLQRGMTRDLSCYQELIHQYEKHTAASEDPLFLWNVTIQNHGGYEHEDYEPRIQLPDAPGKYPFAEEYLTLIQDADNDIQLLFDYFSQLQERVVILFFGDHWPNLEEGFVEQVLGVRDLEKASFQEGMQRYAVPYFLWSNERMEPVGQDFQVTSLNYLSSLLLKAAGLEGTPYNEFLLEMHEQYPIFTAVGRMDAAGNYTEAGATNLPEQERIDAYAMLQYNQMFGKGEKIKEWFERGEGIPASGE